MLSMLVVRQLQSLAAFNVALRYASTKVQQRIFLRSLLLMQLSKTHPNLADLTETG